MPTDTVSYYECIEVTTNGYNLHESSSEGSDDSTPPPVATHLNDEVDPMHDFSFRIHSYPEYVDAPMWGGPLTPPFDEDREYPVSIFPEAHHQLYASMGEHHLLSDGHDITSPFDDLSHGPPDLIYVPNPHTPSKYRRVSADGARERSTEPSDKRALLNVLERARREDLKTSFQSLKDILPQLGETKAVKGLILSAAVDYIQVLNHESTELEASVAFLRAENQRLRLAVTQ